MEKKNEKVVKDVKVEKVVNYKTFLEEMDKQAKAAKIEVPAFWFGQLVDLNKVAYPEVDNSSIKGRYIEATEVEVMFQIKAESYTAYFAKAGKVVAGFIVDKENKIQFGTVSAQSVFKILAKVTKVSIGTLNKMYKSANPTRKDGKSATPKQVLKSF